MKASGWILLPLVAAGLANLAQEFKPFVGWMKDINGACDTLKKAEKKTGAQSVRAAERIGSSYEEMIGFWRQYNAADAVKWSETGKAAAAELANAALAGDAGKAAAAFDTINETCRSCHEARREQLSDRKYRIKTENPPPRRS